MVGPKKPETATVIGSGPNGLSAAIVYLNRSRSRAFAPSICGSTTVRLFRAGENCTKNCIKLGLITPHYTPLPRA
jgi:hypothetical protein